MASTKNIPSRARHLALLLCLLPLASQAQEVSFQLQTEASLTLSISQEADEAIDRAQRWLSAQQAPTHRIDALLRAYALAQPEEPAFRITRCDITPLEHAMPPPEMPESYTNLTATLEQVRREPKRLFALQRDIPQENPPANWRETLALALINTQKFSPKGGHWNNSPEDTLWAILALRALLNESIPVQLAE
jgi:hypothetical protein